MEYNWYDKVSRNRVDEKWLAKQCFFSLENVLEEEVNV